MPHVSPPPARAPFVVKPEYRVAELASYAGESVDTMRRRLRKAGFPAPGRRVPERITLSDLRTRAPAFFDSLVRATISAQEAKALAARLAQEAPR